MNPAISRTSAHVHAGNIAWLEFENLDRWGPYTRLFSDQRSYTNVEELRYAGQLARVLQESGVKPGDRVVAILPNSPELTALYQAVWMIGAIMVPIMPYWTPTEIVPVLRSAAPAAIVTIPQLAARVQPGLTGLESLPAMFVCGPTDSPEAVDICALAAQATPLEYPVNRHAADVALLLYTSGTTAAPKGAMLTHGNLHAAIRSALALNPDLPPGPMLHMLPLAHSFGLIMWNLAHAWGCTSILMKQFDPLQAFRIIQSHRVMYTGVVPTMMVYLLNHPERPNYDLSALRRVTSGGASLPEQLRSDFIRSTGCRLDQGYGLSETVAIATGYAEPDAYRSGSAGRPAPGIQVRIFAEGNRLLPPGQPGEICISGEHVMRGYWRDPDATSAALDGEWLRTGDIGYVDSDGFLYITDRKKDLIIKGGENVSPREIEEALHLHPAVAAAAVVGTPDPLFGENICAIVQPKPGAQVTEDALQAHVAGYLTKFKMPARILFWPELPRNFTGKISKRDIRDRLNREGV